MDDLGGIPRGGARGLREEKSRERLNRGTEGGRPSFSPGDSMRILDGRSIRRNEAADHNGKVAGWSARYIRGGRERRNKRGGGRERRGALLYVVRAIRVHVYFSPSLCSRGRTRGEDNIRTGQWSN